MAKILSAFKELPKGIYRLILVGSFLLPLILGIVLETNDSWSHGRVFLETFILGFIIYWILARIGIWIYQGFKEDSRK